MADFVEHFYISQLDAETYSYCWDQIDLATEEEINLDYEESCSAEDLFEALEAHGFDTDKVFNHFEDYPCSKTTLTACSKIILTDEY